MKFRYLEVTKLDTEDRLHEQNKIVKIAIDRLKQSCKNINQSSVAREIGVNRIIFHNNDGLRKLIEENKTGRGGFNLENLISKVNETIKELEKREIPVNYKNIANDLNLDIGTISQKQEIRDLINNYQIKQWKLNIENLTTTLQKMVHEGQKITLCSIRERTGLTRTMTNKQEIREIIESFRS